MRWVWVLILIAVSGVALADDTATRVAVIEKDVKLLREDVRDLKAQMATKAHYEALQRTITEIRNLVNPKLEKVDLLTAWRDSHMQAHDLVEKGKDRSIVLWIGLATILFTAASFGKDFIVNRRNGNRG